MRNAGLFLLVLFMLVGCRAPKPISVSRPAGEVSVELWVSSDCVQPDETIKLRATVTNHSKQLFVVDLPDKPVLDLVVTTSGKTTRWSDGKPLMSELTHLDLKPKESKTIQMDWYVQCCDSLLVKAPFIDYPKFADSPTTPLTTVSVKHCVGPLGP